MPEDVLVVGLDEADLYWLGGAVLTTVAQPSDESGLRAATAAMELVNGGSPTDMLLPVHVRIGTTTASPPV